MLERYVLVSGRTKTNRFPWFLCRIEHDVKSARSPFRFRKQQEAQLQKQHALQGTNNHPRLCITRVEFQCRHEGA